jgi:hypothetical protein
MGAREFGQLVADRMDELEWSQNKVARRFGELPDGRGLDSTQVRLIKEGRRGLDHALVGRLIEVLGLDPLPAWEAAGLWPPGYSADDLSELRAARREAARRVASPEGATAADPSPNPHSGRFVETDIPHAA